jgi:DNA polymerase III subunit gamma/tau
MIGTAAQFSEEDLTRYLQLSLDLFKSLQFSLQPRLHLELGLIKLVQVGKLQSIEDAIAGLPADALAPLRAIAPAPRTGVAKLAAPPPRSAVQVAPPKPVERFSAPAPQMAPPVEETPPVEEKTGDLKSDLYASLLNAGLKMSADAVQHSDVQLEGTELVFTTAKTFMLSLKDAAVAKAASTLAGKPVKIRVNVDANRVAAPTINTSGTDEAGNASPAPPANDLSERALSHPGVKRFQELFPGSHVRAVRNLNE